MSEIIAASETALTVAYTEALQLHHQIIAHGSTAATAFVEMCRCLKRMRDTQLYKELGFDSFDDYVEQMAGIKQRQAYKYIMIYERYGETALNKHAGLGITKLELIASIPAPDREEFIENNNVMDLSVREVQRLTEELKSTGEQLSLLQAENAKLKAAIKADGDAEDHDEVLEEIQRENELLRERISDLEKGLASSKVATQAGPDEATLEEIRKDAIKAAMDEAKDKIKKAKEDAARQAEKIKADTEAQLKKLQEEKSEADRRLAEAAREADEANARAKKIEAELKIKSSAITTEFSVHFGNVRDGMNKIIAKIEEAAKEDPEIGRKLAQAMLKFLESAQDSFRSFISEE